MAHTCYYPPSILLQIPHFDEDTKKQIAEHLVGNDVIQVNWFHDNAFDVLVQVNGVWQLKLEMLLRFGGRKAVLAFRGTRTPDIIVENVDSPVTTKILHTIDEQNQLAMLTTVKAVSHEEWNSKFKEFRAAVADRELLNVGHVFHPMSEYEPTISVSFHLPLVMYKRGGLSLDEVFTSRENNWTVNIAKAGDRFVMRVDSKLSVSCYMRPDDREFIASFAHGK